MFYVLCVCGIVLTLLLLASLFGQHEDNDRLVVFDVNRGELWAGDELIASYRKGSRNYKVIKLLYNKQGEEVSYDDIKEEIFTKSETIPLSKLLGNLRLPTTILSEDESYISLAQKVSC